MNIQKTPLDITWIKNIKNKQLMKVEALIFCEPGVEFSFNSFQMATDISIEEIGFEFKDLGSCRFFCGADGSSLCFDAASIESISLNEYGEEKIYSLNSQALWIDLIDKNVLSINLIESELEESIFGIHFMFENKIGIVIANIGDNLVISRSLDPEILREEKARSILIF